MKEDVSKLRIYVLDEQGVEAIEKIIIIGAGVVLSLIVIGFMTFQVNHGAENGKDKMQEAILEGMRS